MAFSDAAIGFYLQMEDQMTPQLPGAAKAYEKFVNTLTKLNKKGFDQASGFLGTLGALVKSVEKLTSGAEVQMNLGLSKKSKKSLADTVGDAVVRALSKAKLRLTASAPKNKLKMFSQDATLRTLYKDMPQPPDMIGGFQIGKYAKGGKVGGGTSYEDSVLGMLTPGEVVVPNKLVGKLEKALDFLESAGETIGAGFGSEKDLAMYRKGLDSTAEAMQALTESTQEAGFETQQRLAPQIVQIRKRFEDLTKEVNEETAPSFKKLFEKVLGPVQFLAVSEGVKGIQQGITALRSGMSSTFSTLGGQEIESGIEALNIANQYLGMSRPRLREVKTEVAALAAELDGVTFDELASSFATGAEQGIKNVDMLMELGKAGALMQKGMGVAKDSVIAFGFEFRGAMGQSEEALHNMLGGISALTDETSGFDINASKLFEQMTADAKTLRATLAQMDKDAAQGLLASLNQVGAVLESSFIDGGGIRDIFSRALTGDTEAMGQAVKLTGKSISELRDDLVRGNVTGLFDSLATNVNQIAESGGPLAVEKFAKALGMSAKDLERFAMDQETINANFDKSAVLLRENNQGLDTLRERVSNNKTAFQGLQEMFTDAAANFTLFGVTGTEVLDFLKEFNVVSLWAAGSMLKSFVPAVFSAIGAMTGLSSASLTSTVTMKGAMGAVSGLGKGLLKFGAGAGIVAAGVWVVNESLEYQNKLMGDIAQTQKNLEDDAHYAQIGTQMRQAQQELRKLEQLGKVQGKRQGVDFMLSESQQARTDQLRATLDDLREQSRKRQGVSVEQPATARPSADAKQIQALLDQARAADDGNKKTDETNDLLRRLLEVQMQQRRGEAPAASPAAAFTPTGRSDLTRMIAEMDT